MFRMARYFKCSVEDIFQFGEDAGGQAAFRAISRRASVRAGESNSAAEINK
jgi:DNA-binding XRE family transcriptional regulator